MAKGNQQLQTEAEVARKKGVDAKNRNAAAKEKAKVDKLADKPLSKQQMSFCLDIQSKMNNGRRDQMPCSADILRYSQLKDRMGIVAKVEDDE